MVISANSLFHFTNSLHNIISILKFEFRPHLSLENLEPIFPDLDFPVEKAIPMICFCDLPLSQVRNHISFYGGYGIGMTKEWGARNGLNPVMYLRTKSSLSSHLDELFEWLVVYEPKGLSLNIIWDIISFIKVYEGRAYKKTGAKWFKKFYDEREWRFVPLSKSFKDGLWPYLSSEDYAKTAIRDEINKRLWNGFKVPFRPKDIKYIIVEKEKEKLTIIRAIEEIKGSKYDGNTVKILSSKILSKDQIMEDF